jgi:molybdate transport system substrate-binding protein
VKKMLSAAALAVAVAVTSAACGSGASGDSPQTVRVFAAASLTSTFTELGKRFEADHPGVRVRLSFGGSSDLADQIRAGAPADVFASADTKNMDKLGTTAVDPRDFASNTLEIAVPPGNPAGISSLEDLTRPGVKLVVCAAEVPCGAATQAVAQKAGLTLKPVSEEQSVTDVLGKVSSGEADAGVVYVTDVKGAGSKVEGITFPEAAGVVNVYPIATLHGSKQSRLAQEFVDLVLGQSGQKVLSGAGFGTP